VNRHATENNVKPRLMRRLEEGEAQPTFDPLLTYCAADLPEYFAPVSGGRLVQVQVHHRHGDRLPNEEWAFKPSLGPMPSFTCPAFAYQQSGRTYTMFNEDGEEGYPGNCTYGQLTQTGWNRLNSVGARLRTIYSQNQTGNSHNLLPVQFDHTKVYTYISESTSNRCVMSSLALQEGLFPARPNGDSAVFHYRSGAGGDILGTPWSCTNFSEITERAIAEPTWQAYLNNFVNPESIIAASAWDVTPQEAVSMFNTTLDYFSVVKCSSELPYPGGFNETAAGALAAVRGAFYWSFATLPWANTAFASAWYEEVLSFLQAAANNTTTVQYVEWSGHDISLMMALGALNITATNTEPAVQWPGYGSTLVIELWEVQSSPFYKVRFLYNGLAVELPRYWCWDTDRTLCALSDFTRMVQQQIAPPGWTNSCPVLGKSNAAAKKRRGRM
jgi:hypothetical protein